MQCHEARKQIPKLIDGLLNFEQEFAVRQHVNQCPNCRALMRTYEQDEQAVSGYMRRAPYAPVARNVTEEISRQRSPWWDAFRAGSHRLASVAGLVLVVLVVGAGAWMLRDVATTDPVTDDEPAQEVMIGTTDDEPQEPQVDEPEPSPTPVPTEPPAAPDPDPDPEPEPTPVPTEPPMVAVEPEPTPVPEEEVVEPPPVPMMGDDEEPEPEPLRTLVYMARGEEVGIASREIEYTQDVATASIEALLAGLGDGDADAGLHTEIPAGTELRDISLNDGTLTVDLSAAFAEGGGSASMLMRLAQVVHTGTQFSSVNNVQILIEGEQVDALGGEGVYIGEPLDRTDFEDQVPSILIEMPAPYEAVGSQIQLRGTSNTFEATLQIEVLDPMGNQIYRDFATATAGTGTRGEFDLTIDVAFEGDGVGTIRMFEESAEDGEDINVVSIPVRFE